MKRPIQLISLAQHFLAEGIITFLFLIPIFHSVYHFVPYWTYLLSLFAICMLFTFYTVFTNRFFWYICTAPILSIGYYFLLNYPLLLSAAIPTILVWRYVQLRKDNYFNSEMTYLVWTALLTIVFVLFFSQNEAVTYLIVQFSLLLLGFLTGHAVTMSTHSRNQFLGKLWLPLTGAVVIVGAGIFLFNRMGIHVFMKFWNVVVVNIWNVMVVVFTFFASIPMYLLSLLNIEVPENFGPADSENIPGVNTKTQMGITEQSTSLDTYTTILYWLFIAVLSCIILYFLFKFLKRRFEPEEETETELTTYHALEKEQGKESVLKRLRSNLLKRQPTHPVRKLVYQFERTLEKSDKGRKNYETIEEWFERVDIQVSADAYQKVRYGLGKVNEQEIKRLKNELERWKKHFHL